MLPAGSCVSEIARFRAISASPRFGLVFSRIFPHIRVCAFWRAGLAQCGPANHFNFFFRVPNIYFFMGVRAGGRAVKKAARIFLQ